MATHLASILGIINPGHAADRFLVARTVTVVLGTLTPYFVYLAGNRAFGKGVGLVAALLAAAMPIAVMHSHFATVDVPATFWVAVCLAASSAILDSRVRKYYILAGVTAGFAAATKYGAGIVLIAPLVAHFVANGEHKKPHYGMPAWLLGGALVGFTIGNPAIVLWPGEFWDAFNYEFTHAGAGHGFVFQQTGPGWIFHLKTSLRYGLGLPVLLLSLAGSVLMLRNKSRRAWPICAFALAYFVVISLAEVRFARYIIPLISVLSIAAAIAITTILGWAFRRRTIGLRRLAFAVWAVAFAAVLYFTVSYTVALDRLFVMPDTRDTAARWIERSVPKGSTIAFPTLPWFYSPSLSPEFTNFVPAARYDALLRVTRYTLITDYDRPWDAEMLWASKAECVVISDFEDIDAYRIRDPDAMAYKQVLDADYAPAVVIRNVLRAGGLDFGPTENLPHDMKYASPRITIYKRRV